MDNINIEKIKAFKLPSYAEIPGVGLFLEQVSKYINECLSPLGIPDLTGSMISNYVKKDIIDNPVKKQYSRDQIVYLMFIAVAKSVLSLEDISLLMELQKQICSPEEAYNFFSDEFARILDSFFIEKSPIIGSIDIKTVEKGDIYSVKNLCVSILMTVVFKIHLDMIFLELKEEK